MHTITRVLVTSALALPLAFSAAGVASACDDHSGQPEAHKHHHHKSKVDQDQDNRTDQSNSNKQPIYQINVGDNGVQNASAVNDQKNDNNTDENQDAN